MTEVEGIAFFQRFLDYGPHFSLSRVGEQKLFNRSSLRSFFHREQVFAWNPAVFNCQIVISLVNTAFFLTDYDFDSIVSHVEGLSATLDAVSESGDYFAF